jgi:hypothetical protein
MPSKIEDFRMLCIFLKFYEFSSEIGKISKYKLKINGPAGIRTQGLTVISRALYQAEPRAPFDLEK